SCGGTIEESPRWYAEGIAHLTEQKQYAIAFDLLEEGIERYPQSAMLWYNGGVLEELLGNRDGALTRYQKVLELRPNNEKARKALERLLGRPLFTPPPATSYAATQAGAAEPPVATTPPPAVTLPAPPRPAEPAAPAPAAEAPAAAPVERPAPAGLPAPAVGPNGAEDVPPAAALPMALPIAEPGALPWALIRLINGLLALLSFIGMLVGMIVKHSAAMTIALLLFTVTLILFYIAGALDSTPRMRRRR
ncbi:MAG TPA: hypothetical protein PLZ36_08800, partial [Armatimonadota bacterium]|nr:hypothetical protein [Armatimonadota bacterium]